MQHHSPMKYYSCNYKQIFAVWSFLLTWRILVASVIKHPRFMEEEFTTIHLHCSWGYIFSTFPSFLSFSSWWISILQNQNESGLIQYQRYKTGLKLDLKSYVMNMCILCRVIFSHSHDFFFFKCYESHIECRSPIILVPHLTRWKSMQEISPVRS